MQRRLQELFQQRGPGFLPKIYLIAEVGQTTSPSQSPDASKALTFKLELVELIRNVMNRIDGFGAENAAFDLSQSLYDLFVEMQREGVDPDDIDDLDMRDHAAYWARSKAVLQVIKSGFLPERGHDIVARQRRQIETYLKTWRTTPPTDPILVAGSTGSHGTTRLFMEAVARLPQGAVIFPGFDDQMPSSVWSQLDDPRTGEDHPQFRFRKLANILQVPMEGISPWTKAKPHSQTRNALISLALRPAPVTHAWLNEGPKLTEVETACAPVTWLEARDPAQEATAIALRLRKAVEDGQTAAVITPDRTLTRQIAANLNRWDIEPDDSAGIPLELTATGRMIRQTAAILGSELDPVQFLTLLKQPMVNNAMRSDHLRHSRDLEIEVLRGGPPQPNRRHFEAWASARNDSAEKLPWITWILDCLDPLMGAGSMPLTQLIDLHLRQSERLAAGLGTTDLSALWQRAPGEAAHHALSALRDAARDDMSLSLRDYRALIDNTLKANPVRDPVRAHPGVMIWGTLEARVQGADLVILAGLNDGSWPEIPTPDPWLNRQMRDTLGLLLPERNIGLAAHDFQQAIAAREIWLTRSLRSSEAETVPSRWLNRLRNLLTGLENGRDAYRSMTERAQSWLAWSDQLDRPATRVPQQPRPAPQPPIAARPKSLSVTRIETLIRDPYAIYARYILKLKPLESLQPDPDAALRGQVIHTILERFTNETKDALPPDALDLITRTTDETLERDVPWPATRTVWRAQLETRWPRFLTDEAARRARAHPLVTEAELRCRLELPEFTLLGRADRIDVTPEGSAIIYDYKTGELPTKSVVEKFNRQLPLLALALSRGRLEPHGAFEVSEVGYIGLGHDLPAWSLLQDEAEIAQTQDEFVRLMAAYTVRAQGYVARRAVFSTAFQRDYDHLSRYGEWNESDPPVATRVGP